MASDTRVMSMGGFRGSAGEVQDAVKVCPSLFP